MKKYSFPIAVSSLLHLLIIFNSYEGENNLKQMPSLVLTARIRTDIGVSSAPKRPVDSSMAQHDGGDTTESIAKHFLQAPQAVDRSEADNGKALVVPPALGPIANASDFSVRPPQVNNPDDKPVGPFGGSVSRNAFQTIAKESKDLIAEMSQRRYTEQKLQVDQRIYILKSFVARRHSELLALERPTSCRVLFDMQAQFGKIECTPMEAAVQELSFFVGETKFVSSSNDYPYCLQWGHENSKLKC